MTIPPFRKTPKNIVKNLPNTRKMLLTYSQNASKIIQTTEINKQNATYGGVKMPRSIGKIVREIRGDRTQKQFSELLDVHITVISDIENNRREPSKRVAKKLAILSGKPMETFVN